MLPRHVRRAGLILPLFLAFEGAGHAGSFDVSPVRAELSATQRVAALTVRNSGHASAVIQLQATNWTQQDNHDVLTPTDELLATPPIFTLAPGASQVVRVGSRRASDANVELAYRLSLQEVPPPADPSFQGLRVALRISLPVFFAPTVPARPKLTWQATRVEGGKLRLSVRNEGAAHSHLTGLTVASRAAAVRVPIPDANVYVLPSTSHTWLIDAKAAPGESLHIDAHDDTTVIQVDVPVDVR